MVASGRALLADEGPAETPPAARRGWRTGLVAAAGLGLIVGGALAWALFPRATESTDDAFLDGHISQVSPKVAGRVARVLAGDNQAVREGDPLVELDASHYRARADQARAALGAAQAATRAAAQTAAYIEASVKAGLEQASAELEAARAQVERAQAEATALEAESQRTGTELEQYQRVQQQGAGVPQE